LSDYKEIEKVPDPIKEYWQNFLSHNSMHVGRPFTYFTFGDDPNGLLEAVLSGKKTGTSSLYKLYSTESVAIPTTGLLSIVCDKDGNPRCIIEITNVCLFKFRDITENHAKQDIDEEPFIENWKSVHFQFFKNECDLVKQRFKEDDMVVFEEFVKIYE